MNNREIKEKQNQKKKKRKNSFNNLDKIKDQLTKWRKKKEWNPLNMKIVVEPNTQYTYTILFFREESKDTH